MSANSVVRITIIALNMVISYAIVVLVREAVVMMRMDRLHVAPVMEQEKNDTKQNLTRKKLSVRNKVKTEPPSSGFLNG
ncbi:hypothetical protein [Serratia sp. Se-RSBMAAmG]|uniref:hypothetical protein n=1 Tax=Serratia sp. Se-RSBMAAmG TaxID=3043305 RepID=UPI0024AEE8A4|nr:hypothetical protein [Serratia sp. Se-RSBMAAmG]MDI6977284.1 hypothetical protein [Serratia sp. Se-RSBMAAmG]